MSDLTTEHGSAAQMFETGVAHHRAGRLDEARSLYERTLAVIPGHADALHLIGVIAIQRQRYAEAFDFICRAIEISEQAIYFDNLGSALFGWGKLTAAAESHQQAIALDPQSFRAHNNFGNVLHRMRLPAAAAASFRAAVALNADFAEAHNNLGNVLRELGESAMAAEHCRKAIVLNPEFGEAHNNLGNALRTQGKLAEAAECYRTAQRLMPQEAQVRLNLGIVHREMGKPDEGIAYFREALALRPSWAEAWSNLLFSLSFAENVAPDAYLREALTFGRIAREAVQPYTEWSVDATPGAPLRVGFVSGDLRSHPVGYFLEGVLAHVDPSRMRFYAYSTRSIEDALTARIKPHFAVWRTLVGLDDEQAARAIHDDGIQVLLDLSGHTDSNRLPVFAWKPAPVQASWIGYFASTGLAAIDYVLGDEWVLPPDEASHFIERPWRLPHGYLCFTPPEPPVEIDASRREAEAAPTFGYLGDFSKVNDRVAAVWARILSRVSGSKLFLKAFQFGDETEREAARKRFAALGIGAERLVLEGPSPRAEYLAAYNRVDLTLSPFPYPGGTTTAESLWMGVPVLCRRGDRFLGHLCESVVRSVGLDDWIAADDDDYIEKAIGFVRDRQALATLTSTLRARVLASSLTDAPRFARTLEDTFAAMWRTYESAA